MNFIKFSVDFSPLLQKEFQVLSFTSFFLKTVAFKLVQLTNYEQFNIQWVIISHSHETWVEITPIMLLCVELTIDQNSHLS